MVIYKCDLCGIEVSDASKLYEVKKPVANESLDLRETFYIGQPCLDTLITALQSTWDTTCESLRP